MFYRQIVLITCFFILSHCSKPSNHPLTSSGKGGVKKTYIKVQPATRYYKVRELTSEKEDEPFRYMYSFTGKDAKALGVYYKVSYNEYGQDIRSEYFINNVSQRYILSFYRSDHRLDRLEYYEKNKLISKISYTYKKDRLDRIITRVDGKKLFEYIYNYGDKGQLKYIRKLKQGEVTHTEYYDGGLKVSEERLNNLTLDFFYDSKGLLQQEKKYSSGEIIGFTHYQYNKKGDRIQVSFYDKDSNPHGRWLFIDGKGNLMFVKVYSRGKLQSVKKLLYDHRRRLVREEDWTNKKNFDYYYLYSYDSKGNQSRWEKRNARKKLLESVIYRYKKGKLLYRKHFKGRKLMNKELFKGGQWVREKTSKSVQ